MVSVYDMDIAILDSGCRCVVPCDTGIQETAKIKTHQIAELQTSCKASDILKERWQMWLSATFIRNDQWSTIIDISCQQTIFIKPAKLEIKPDGKHSV